jgi:hypothetical protein
MPVQAKSRETERKSSRRRSAHASVAGPAPVFNPPPEAWAAIERPFRRFNKKERGRICAIVDRYFDRRRFESAAPLIAHQLAEIKRIERAARKLNGALQNLAGPDAPNPDARLDAMVAIDQQWPGGPRRGSSGATLRLTLSLALACKKAHALDVNKGLVIGSAWEGQVLDLIAFIADCGLKVSASKGQRAASEFTPSPFVVFLMAIENNYPSEVPKRSNSAHNVSNEISRVRRADKKRVKFSAR